MKKYFIISHHIILIALSLLIFSCKDKDAFTISGTINNPGSLKKVYLLATDSSQVSVIDSTNLSENGKFKFKNKAAFANLFKIRAGSAIFDLIAKNGDVIEFTTSLTDNTHAYKISGSDESEKIKAFNKVTDFYVEKSKKITDEYQDKAQALGKESDSLVKIYKPLFQKNIANYGLAVLKFANDNKHSLAG